MTNPTVSIVVPTYCRGDYLREALRSIMAQQYVDYEVIVGNDGGARYIDPIKEQFGDARIRWIDHRERRGLLGNLLDCFRHARGRYLATLHDDDYWSPALLSSLVPPLEELAQVSVAFSDHHIIDRHGRIDPIATERCTRRWRRDRLAPGLHQPFDELAIIHQSLPVQCAAVFRRASLDLAAFPAQANTYYDLWLARELARDGAAAYYVPERLASIRSHPGSQTSTGRLQNARSGLYLHRRFLEDPELAHLPRRPLQRKLSHDHYGVAVSLIRDGAPREAQPHLLASIRLDPNPRAGIALAASLLPPRVARGLLRPRAPAR